MSLVVRISFIFSLIIHLIFRSVNLVTELLLCVNNFGIGELTSTATGQPMEYWMVTTTDDKGNKALGGGMMKRQMPEQQVTDYMLYLHR